MDIKSKNKTLHKIVLILFFYLIGLSLLLSFDIITHKGYFAKDPYFSSNAFKNEIDILFQNIRSINTYYKDYENKSDKEKLSENELSSIIEENNNNLKKNQDDVEKLYINYVNEATKTGNTEKVNLLIDAKNKRLQDLKKENEINIANSIKKLAANKDANYKQIKESLSSKEDIKYYIKNKNTKEIHTNLEKNINIENYIKDNALYSISFPQELHSSNYFWSMNNFFKNSNLEGYFIVPENLNSYSQIVSNYKYYNSIRQRLLFEGLLLVLSLALSLTIFIIYLKNKNEMAFIYLDKTIKFLEKIPLDLRVFLFMILLLFMLVYFININFFYKPINSDHIFKLTFIAVMSFYWSINMASFYRIIKDRKELSNQWKKSILYRINFTTRKSFENKSTFTNAFLITMFTSFFGFFICLTLVGIGTNTEILIFLSILYIGLYLIIYIPYALRKISLFDKILEGSEEILSGNLNHTINEKGSGKLLRLASNINNMKIGFKKSIESQMKSERLKSELITNVSHDLKTPLTSIINYVDLLKREGLSKEEMEGYISILDRKTQRLKVLIEDLFEASKVASGAIELNIEKIDVAALLTQTLAEFDEKIKDSSLTFRVNGTNKKIYANLDGKKTWRVFDNLINNALKYSQENTRVYIDLIEYDNKVTLSVKNISSYEMDFNVEEIFERFKRGDKSRNTDGSGLGLAIAKSIVELQGGKLDIEIDGDLFKAIVKFYK